MAINVGNVYFDALLRTQQLEAQVAGLERKHAEIQFDVLLRSQNLKSEVAKVVNNKHNLVFDAAFRSNSLRNQVDKATSGLGRTIDITANVTTRGVSKLKSSLDATSVAFGNSIADAISTAANTALNAAQAITNAGVGFARESATSYADVNSQINILSRKIGATVADPIYQKQLALHIQNGEDSQESVELIIKKFRYHAFDVWCDFRSEIKE